jgi:tetratricopeptide (TPR) repeat protein
MNMDCANCGFRDPALGPGGRVVVVHETSPKELGQLFRGELRTARCEVCGDPLDADLSIVCVSEDPPRLDVSLGSRAGPDPSSVAASALGSFSGDGIAHETTDQLIECIAARIKRRIAVFNEAASAATDGRTHEFVEKHWRRFTPEVFAAGIASLSAAVPGVVLVLTAVAGKKNAESPDPLRYFAQLQANTWLGLCMSWMRDGTHSDSLQQDLDRYVLSGVVLPGAVEKFDRFAAALLGKDMMFHSVYTVEAVRAALHGREGIPNPGARGWALSVISFEYAYRRNLETLPAKLRLMRVTKDLARNTIAYADAWWAAKAFLASLREQDDPEAADVPDLGERLDTLTDVVEFVGHGSIVARIVSELLPDLTVESLLHFAEAARQRGDDVRSVLTLIRQVDEPLIRQRRIDDLELLADGLLSRFPSSDSRAAVEAWLGSRLKLLRLPERFLARVGVEAQEWEAGLDGHHAAPFLTERSNALRLSGKSEAALTAARQALDVLPENAPSENRAVGKMNVAILLRETGSPDAALDILAEIADNAPVGNRLNALQSMAVTLATLRRTTEAVTALERALALAHGPYEGEAPAVHAMIANLTAWDAPEHSVATIRGLLKDPAVLAQAQVLLPVSATLICLIPVAPQLLDDLNIDEVRVSLTSLKDQAAASGDLRVACEAARATAWFDELLGSDDAEAAWLAALDLSRDLGSPDDIGVLVRLAAFAYARDDVPTARALLKGSPAALRRRFGGAVDLLSIARGAEDLRELIQGLAGDLLDFMERSGTPAWVDLRYVADLGRSAVARAMVPGSDHREDDEPWPDDDTVATIADPRRAVAVVEWIETGGYFMSFITTIKPDGTVRAQFLRVPDEDIFAVATLLPNLVRGWRRGREGDPLDDPRWQAVVAWWQEVLLSGGLVDGDHVVVLEHPDLVGLPWQAASGSRWTCSYSSGWFALLTRPHVETPTSIGIVRVPKFGDTEEVRTALLLSTDQTRALAHQNHLTLTVTEGPEADATAVVSLLKSVDVAKLLCHGYMDVKTSEVGLAVAADGSLPLRQSIAAGTKQGRRHRLDWSELQGLGRAPQVVFSLACLSGVVHTAGLGERLGLFTAFSSAGTLSLIAPRWEVPPREVAPILDAALELWLGDGMDLSQALQQACVEASRTLAPRYAWCLTLEGTWK